MKKSPVTDRFLLVLFGVLALGAMGLSWKSPVAQAMRRGDRVNAIVLGTDYTDFAKHADTLILVSYDPIARFVDLVSIPRDTEIEIHGLPHVRRVNELFAYEYKRSGRDAASAALTVTAAVESLLTYADRIFRIPYYVAMDYDTFRALIDAVGGVWVKVEEPMHYDDRWGKLHIHFDPGTYRLFGQQALEYVRFRGESGDPGRILRQQLFVKQLLRQLKSPLVVFRLPHFVGRLVRGVHTNLGFYDGLVLWLETRSLDRSNVRLFSLPGRPAGPLWRVHPENTRKMVEMIIAPSPQATPARWEEDRTPRIPEARKAVTVEVWNASSQSGVAREVTLLLRSRGFDVVSYGNFSTRQQRTLVIDRSGVLRSAQEIAALLKAESAEVVTRVDPGRLVDVSVILGNDYRAQTR